VRSVRLRQSGHFMVGGAKVAGHEISLSGAYGNDGLPIDAFVHGGTEKYPGLWEVLVPLPEGLTRKFWKSGGHNEPGEEGPSVHRWALEHLAVLQAAGRKKTPYPKKRRSRPSLTTAHDRRVRRRAAKHGVKLTAKQRHEAPQAAYGWDPLKHRAETYERAREPGMAEWRAQSGREQPRHYFDPRLRDQPLVHEKFMGQPRPKLPNGPKTAVKWPEWMGEWKRAGSGAQTTYYTKSPNGRVLLLVRPGTGTLKGKWVGSASSTDEKSSRILVSAHAKTPRGAATAVMKHFVSPETRARLRRDSRDRRANPPPASGKGVKPLVTASDLRTMKIGDTWKFHTGHGPMLSVKRHDARTWFMPNPDDHEHARWGTASEIAEDISAYVAHGSLPKGRRMNPSTAKMRQGLSIWDSIVEFFGG